MTSRARLSRQHLRVRAALFGILSLVLCALNVAVVVRLPTARADDQKTAGQSYKNLKVLKDIPADQLIPAMQFVSSSLGVECEFCHVRDSFDRDDKKPKQIARQMMQMMYGINGQNFQNQRAVTCYTCHRGSAKPVSIPLLDSTAAYTNEAASAEDPAVEPAKELPSANDVLDRYVQALGGAAAIENVSSRIESGSVSFGAGPSFPVEIFLKSPGKQLMVVHLPSGDSKTAIDGQIGWSSIPGAPVRDMHQAEIDGARLDADLQFATHLKKTFSDLKVIRAERVKDHDAILVFASNSGQPPVELYFDRQSGLLLRQIRFASSPLGLNPTQIDYADYAADNGIQLPRALIITRPNRTMTIQLSKVSGNVAIDDSKFARP